MARKRKIVKMKPAQKKAVAEKPWKLKLKTLEIHGGGSEKDTDLRPGLYRATAFPLGSFERAKKLFAGEERGFIYTRINNRTVDRLEKRVAALEGAGGGLSASSGLFANLMV